MRQRASGTVNPEMKKQTYICSPRYFVFFSYYTNAKREYHDDAQADFDFGQVHVIWWLSYYQVEEKISVEPCSMCLFLYIVPILCALLCEKEKNEWFYVPFVIWMC